MNIVSLKPRAQLALVVDNTRSVTDEHSDPMTQDEYAALMTAFRGRLVEPHEAYTSGGGPDAA